MCDLCDPPITRLTIEEEFQAAITEINRLRERSNAQAESLYNQEQELIALRERLAKYDEWFAANATNLATHRIGGYSFESEARALALPPITEDLK